MANDRITITQPLWLHLGGQGVVIYPGSVVDVLNYKSFDPSHYSNLIVGGGTAVNNQITPVSNVRTR